MLRSSIALPLHTVVVLAALFPCSAVRARTIPCNEAEQAAISKMITVIEHSTDPCGGSAEVMRLLEKVKKTSALYHICTDRNADRNSFDRAPDQAGNVSRTITWNPELRNELELGCDGDPDKPVLRDPGASLLHELAHAAQDADGLDPTEHELDAVRIENIYRRAVGMCQRAHYGGDPLPPHMIISCEPDLCRCTSPADAARPQLADLPAAPHRRKQSTVVRTSDSSR